MRRRVKNILTVDHSGISHQKSKKTSSGKNVAKMTSFQIDKVFQNACQVSLLGIMAMLTCYNGSSWVSLKSAVKLP